MEIGYLNLNAAYQPGEHSLTQRLFTPLYDETATYDVNYVSSPDVALDAALGFRVWSNLAVGLGATQFRYRHGVDVTGTVPHPLFYMRHREARDRPGGFDRTDVGVHLQVAWVARMADRLDVTLSAGPSLLRVELDWVSSIVPLEVGPPYDAVQADLSRASLRKNVPGVNAGVDLMYHLARSLEPGARFWTAGIGIFLRWTAGTSALDEFGPDETIALGGLHGGVGLRFRF